MRYPSRAVAMEAFVSSASATRLLIMLLVTLDCWRVLMRGSLSRIMPSASCSSLSTFS